MKKVLLAVLFSLFAFSIIPAFAQDIDLTSLGYEELSKLKKEVDYEYSSRPEAEPFIMQVGSYKVGIDIAPGTYYINRAKLIDEYPAQVRVYDEKGDSRSMPYATIDDVNYVTLNAGDTFTIYYADVIFSSQKNELGDLYELPEIEGTFVPKGKYTIGEEIPAGSYEIYPTALRGSTIYIYAEKESTDYNLYGISFDQKQYGQVLRFSEGNYISLSEPVYMKKTVALNFD